MTERCVVVHAGGIGDLILASPALRVLASQANLDLVGYAERAQLLVDAGIARRGLSMDAVDFGSVSSTPSPRLREFLSGASRAVVWMADPDGTLAAALHGCGVGQVLCAPGIPPASWDRHASEYYAETLGLAVPVQSPQLALPAEPSGCDVVLHPGSGSPNKNWPMDRYAALAQKLERRGLRVAWSLGPAEEHLLPPNGAMRLAPESLVHLGRILARARGYVGNDTGITHLAAAVGCPTVALFGPTNATVWGPRGHAVRILQGAPWPEVPAVEHALLDTLIPRT